MPKTEKGDVWEEKQTLMRDAIVRHTRFFLETEPTPDFVNVLLQDFETLLFQKLQEERGRIAGEIDKLCDDNNNAQGELWEFKTVLRDTVFNHQK